MLEGWIDYTKAKNNKDYMEISQVGKGAVLAGRRLF